MPQDKPPQFDSLLLGVADEVRRIRKEKGVSEEMLHITSGISLTTLSRIETAQDNPTLLTLAKIADTLGCSLQVSFIPPPRRRIVDNRKQMTPNVLAIFIDHQRRTTLANRN